MSQDFIEYRKFADPETAEEVCEQLKENNLEYHIADSAYSLLKIIGDTQIDPGITINLKGEDFPKADKVLDNYYAAKIENIDKDHYIFQFSDEELKNVVLNPYEWGPLDFQLAKKLLKDKGVEYSQEFIDTKKKEKIDQLSKVKKVSPYKLVLGYIFSILLPAVGLLIGLLIINTRNVLPNGEKKFTYTEPDRLHGKIIMGISIAWVIIIVYKLVF